jgi:hypothetical protein
MNDQNDLRSILHMQTLSDIPTPNENAQQIVALVKESGRITGYQLSDGRIVDKAQGVQLAKQGEIRGVGVATRYGHEYLKSLPDGSENNNLGNLPSITQQ